MITSYSKNIHLSSLFIYYTLDSQVSLSSCMGIKTDLLFFLTFCCIIIPISGIIVILKKYEENKNKLRTIHSKNQKNVKSNKSRFQV